MKTKKTVFSALLTLAIVLGCGAGFTAKADADTSFYVALSRQNYAVRNANKMTATDGGEYVLENVALSGAEEFYVTDGHGVKYLASDGKNMRTDETGSYSYTIKFSPNKIYSEEENGFAATDCRVTYAFYTPAEYSVEIGGVSHPLTYNPYFTSYELYYISHMRLDGGTAVTYNGEIHTVENAGAYRILFTPGEVRSGNNYAFDSDGRYGSGDGYIYNLYIEDASEYFVAAESGVAEIITDETPVSIDGKTAYPLHRYENNVAAAEYRFEKLFVSGRDTAVRYVIYERTATGRFETVDDDNDEDTTVSRLDADDAGRYALSLTSGENGYIPSLVKCDTPLGGWYAAGEFNDYCFDSRGNAYADKAFKFEKIESGDDDYNEDYEQYVLYLNVSKSSLENGNAEFYITDGKDSYRNGNDYISLNTAGRYKILFSEEHVYSLGRHYRYTLTEETESGAEIEISSTDDFISFARKCSESADYSKDLSVYLTCDLDFEGIKFERVKTFGGKFFGGYHSLKNITLQNGASVFGLVTRSGRIERLTVENLVIDDKNADHAGFVGTNYGELKKITVSGSITGGNRVGAIAAENGIGRINEDSATIDSNDVVQTGVCSECINLAAVSGKSNVGGIVGFSAGDVLSCENRGRITPFTADSSASLTNFGGIAGFSAGKISDCTNFADVGADDYSLYVGGTVGFCTGENYFCVNLGSVTGNKYVGGVIGGYGSPEQSDQGENGSFGSLNYAEIINRYFSSDESGEQVLTGARHNLIYLINRGNVSAANHAAGVLAFCNYNGITVENSLSVGNITAAGGGYAGGILGRGENVSVISSFSSGKIAASGTGASYVGGIMGRGGAATACMSNASLFGDDYTGGIAGYAAGTVNSCYTFVTVICDGDNKGGIAGGAAYNASLDKFPDGFGYNYYVGTIGGIAGMDYSANFDFAASRTDAEKLLSEDGISPYLNENFSHEYWQGGGENGFPALRRMTECAEINDIDDEEELFAKHAGSLASASETCFKQSFCVVFMEWNADNGDLSDDDGILYENFEEIFSARVTAGGSLGATLKYASDRGGKSVYTGGGKNYFVYLPYAENVRENTVIYAEYRETATTLATSDNSVLAEGLFDAQTEIKLVNVGESYRIDFYLNGEKIKVGEVTVKFRINDPKAEYTVTLFGDDKSESTNAEISGDYLRFTVSDGETFSVTEKAPNKLSALEITLICVLSVVLAAAITVTAIILVKKKKRT